ncbi:hypothetical protein FACS1894180_0340 [Bacteroidia bacterium]|nr:hypothetical protein FACS1894178_5660 [Bacteroidia bacterium]GHV42856.1 hypothetical protein FACS1894180_0340 [Bacteroidia bacterium]
MYNDTNYVITLADGEQNSTLDAFIARIKKAFNRATKRVYKEKGYNVEMLKDKEIKALINETNKAFQRAISYGIKDNVIPEQMKNNLQHNAFMFSGFKVHHELSEVGLSLFDDKGNIKGFDAFRQDVKKINSQYNDNYLQAEYQFSVSSSQAAANFARDSQDEDRYFLQYRTADDNRVRESHKELEGITLPASDPFWSKYYPPNGWNCRCFVNQVRRTKYPSTNPDEAMKLGELATTQLDKSGKNKAAIFRFNPGQTGQLFPPKHPYFPKGCGDCPYHDITLAYKPESIQCQACKQIRELFDKQETWQEIPTEQGKVMLSSLHGKNEKRDNIEIATYLANKHKYEIYLLAKDDNKNSADSFNKTLNITQEYKTNKTNTFNAIDNAIRSGSKQSNNLVLLIKSDINEGVLRRAIHSRVKREANVETITIIIDNKDNIYYRKDIVKDNWTLK